VPLYDIMLCNIGVAEYEKLER